MPKFVKVDSEADMGLVAAVGGGGEREGGQLRLLGKVRRAAPHPDPLAQGPEVSAGNGGGLVGLRRKAGSYQSEPKSSGKRTADGVVGDAHRY